jgi:hypothetical protein
MRDLNEFGKFGEKKRHNSLDNLKKRNFIPANHIKSNAFKSQYGKLILQRHNFNLNDYSE